MAKESKNVKVKKDGKEKKNSNFFKESRAELKKVTWPTPKQLASKTAVVIAIVLIIAIIVFVLDTVFDKGYEFIMDKATKNTNQTVTVNAEENANEIEVQAVDATENASVEMTPSTEGTTTENTDTTTDTTTSASEVN